MVYYAPMGHDDVISTKQYLKIYILVDCPKSMVGKIRRSDIMEGPFMLNN